MSALKKKRYYFNEEWELTYFCAMINDTCTCLICNATIVLPKKENVERQVMTWEDKSLEIIFFLVEQKLTKSIIAKKLR